MDNTNCFLGTKTRKSISLFRSTLISTAMVICICAGAVRGATSLGNTLDAELVDLSTTTNQLGTDQTAVFNSLKSISNLSSGALLTANVVSVHPGGTVDVALTLVPGPTLPAAIELALTVPAGITLSSVSIGPAATAAGKELSMNGGQLIEFGLNQTVIGQGVVAIAHLSIPAATTKALYSIGLTNPVVSDASGKAVIVSATSGVVVVN